MREGLALPEERQGAFFPTRLGRREIRVFPGVASKLRRLRRRATCAISMGAGRDLFAALRLGRIRILSILSADQRIEGTPVSR